MLFSFVEINTPVDKSLFLGSRVNFQFLGSYPRENCALHPRLGRAIRRSGFGLRDFCHWPAIRHNSTSRRPLRNNGSGIRFRFHPPRGSIVLRPALLFISVAALTTALAAEPGRDPEFARVPFDEWVAQGKPGPFKWSFHVSKPQLSVHQRMFASTEVLIDGIELAKRRGQGKFVIFVQIKDANDKIYQDHGDIDLEKVEEAVKSSNITFTDSAFYLPGEYRVEVAIYCAATKEFGVRKTTLHVAAPLGDIALVNSWRDLPPVEIRPVAEPPDSWFLPSIKGRVHFTATPKTPLLIDLVANITPSEHESGSLHIQDRNLSFLIPALKVLAHSEYGRASVNTSLVDLVRQKVTFLQEKVTKLDWLGMRSALASADPGIIDVKTLEKQQQKVRFFLREINKRVGEKPSSRVLVILSSAVTFGRGEEMEPLHLETPTDCRVYYIRYQAEGARLLYGPQPPMGRRRRGGPIGGGGPTLISPEADQLAPMLKALSPKIFDVKSAADLRKAIGTIMTDISGM